MTIDKAIEVLLENIVLEGRQNGKNIRALFYDALIGYLNELKWYRSQDFIRRSDAIREIRDTGIEHYVKSGMHNDVVTNALDTAIVCVQRIPKAEPPKEDNQ